MKTYNLPISWVQQGVVQVNAETLQTAIDKLADIEIGTMGIIGKTIPRSTSISYPMLKDFVKDEVLSETVRLYISSKMPECPFCDKARTFFKENKIAFEEIDVIKDQEAAAAMNKRSNSFAVPQVEVGNEVFVGFTEPVVKAALVRYDYLEEQAGDKAVTSSAPAHSSPPPVGPPADMPAPADIPRKKLSSKELLENLVIKEDTKQLMNVVADKEQAAAYVKTSSDEWFKVDSTEVETALKLKTEDQETDNAKEKEIINA
tara:strand:- start:7478 stop:8257 length:780 start_codon:yes stop_codon:yes gene_type:complete